MGHSFLAGIFCEHYHCNNTVTALKENKIPVSCVFFWLSINFPLEKNTDRRTAMRAK